MLKVGSMFSPFTCQSKKLTSTATQVNSTRGVFGQIATPDVRLVEELSNIELEEASNYEVIIVYINS